MAINFLNSQRGQTSIEFMVIIVLLLVYIQTVLQPFLANTQNAVQDTERLAQARITAERIVQTVNEIGTARGESRITLNVFVPKKTKLLCNPVGNKIDFEVQLSSIQVQGQEYGNIPECINNVCSSRTNVIPSLAIARDISINCGWNELNGESIDQIRMRIEKIPTGVVTLAVLPA